MHSVLVQTTQTLGRLLLMRLHLEVRTKFPNLAWHCSRVEVRTRVNKTETDTPEEPEVQVFLCDRWLRAEDGPVELRSGKCKKCLC